MYSNRIRRIASVTVQAARAAAPPRDRRASSSTAPRRMLFLWRYTPVSIRHRSALPPLWRFVP
nr:MAG TPA: hypothetical protein [Caudoviricetes sp.]